LAALRLHGIEIKGSRQAAGALTNPSYTHCNGKPQFPVTYDAAGLNPLLVGWNKTVIGVGNQGRIMGKGLAIRCGASNIIIRNLSTTDINQGIVFAGDAINIDNGGRVWIDHNYFARIGRQMFGAPPGASGGFDQFSPENSGDGSLHVTMPTTAQARLRIVPGASAHSRSSRLAANRLKP
jgi:pectate lyase